MFMVMGSGSGEGSDTGFGVGAGGGSGEGVGAPGPVLGRALMEGEGFILKRVGVVDFEMWTEGYCVVDNE